MPHDLEPAWELVKNVSGPASIIVACAFLLNAASRLLKVIADWHVKLAIIRAVQDQQPQEGSSPAQAIAQQTAAIVGANVALNEQPALQKKAGFFATFNVGRIGEGVPS